MKSFVILTTVLILLSGCGGTAQTNPGTVSIQNPTAASPKPSISPIPDNIGLVLQCVKCSFVDEKGLKYVTGKIHSDAKQALSGYVMAVDLQDAKGQSVKKIPGLMLMEIMTLQPGETKEFKERVMSAEPNVSQAVVYLKRAGKDVKLSSTLTLKLTTTPPSPSPTPAKKVDPRVH